jgi:hypothetical protein
MNEIIDALYSEKNSWWYILWPQKAYDSVDHDILWNNR